MWKPKEVVEDWMEIHLLERVRLRVFLWSLGVPLATVLVATIWPDMGQAVDSIFYAVVAQVIPVLLLTFFVEESSTATRLRDEIREDRKKTFRMTQEEVEEKGWVMTREEVLDGLRNTEKLFLDFAWVGASVMGIRATFGEALALYALASGETNSFLLAGCSLSILMMFIGLTRTFLSRMRSFGSRVVAPEDASNE